MQQIFPEIVSNEKIAENVYEMKLRGDFSAIKGAGQFVNLTVDGCYLRRPISVCDAENGVLTLVFKVVGKGTEIMSRMQAKRWICSSDSATATISKKAAAARFLSAAA